MLAISVSMLVGCAAGGGGGSSGGGESDEIRDDDAEGNANDAGEGQTPEDDSAGGIVQNGSGLVYVLQTQDVSIQELAQSGFSWMILEPSRTGGADGDFTAQEIETIRTDGPCRKTILAYLSVGEAEDYRDYWDASWVDGEEGPPITGVAPGWLGPTNPDWPGNYKVRYWMEEWQSIILGTGEGTGDGPLDRIIDAGFDGVYLDIIDAFYFWSEPEGIEELTFDQARELMIEWVRRISEHARVTRGVEGFMVFPQNAADIIRGEDDALDELSEVYFSAISGIGIEDLYYDGMTERPADDGLEYRIEQLVEYRDRGKTVLVTDYLLADSYTPANSDERAADFYRRVLDAGFVPYAATEDRDLDEIVTLSSADDWSVDQPADTCE